MNSKRPVILLGTSLLGLSLVLLWVWSSTGIGLTVARAAGPWYVVSGGSDSNSCLDPSTPCGTINGAIGKASGGNTIYVAIGTYTGTGNEVVVIDKDITLSGGWDATFSSQSGTSTIDGENAREGIVVNDSVSANVDHFTIQYGFTDFNGGGVHNSGTLTLTNSTISYNYVYYNYFTGDGGGIYNRGSLTLINSSVSHNTAAHRGGGIYATNGSSTIIIGSKIYANISENYEGGGIQVEGHLNMSGSWVVGNAALDNDAGGIEAESAYIENSIIAGNFAGRTGGGLRNGGYRIVNSHIVGNVAMYEGAAIDGGAFEITNTLIISNISYLYLLGTGIDDGDYILSHCDTYGNSPDGTVGVTITRTNCLGTPPEDGVDPLMAGGALPGGVGADFADDWLSYDYRLLPGSPAIGAGTATGAPATDIDGNPRDATPDLGAYEYLYPKYIYLPLISR